MKLKILIAAAALAVSGAAIAQPGPGGGGAPSPEMQAARDAMMKACAADLKTLCDGKEGREPMQCIRQGGDKLSAGCKDAMAKMPARRGPPGGGAGGPPPGGN